jgi:hypothetical protein
VISYKDYVAGWLDIAVSDVLDNFPSTYERLSYALITCIDSNRNTVSLLERSPELRKVGAMATPLGDGFVVSTEKLLEAHSESRFFFGFDEIWFFPNKPVEAKPPSTSLVGPERISSTTLAELGKWMSKNSCSMALGDGTGMNCIVKARGLMKYILAFSYEQPGHSDVEFE